MKVPLVNVCGGVSRQIAQMSLLLAIVVCGTELYAEDAAYTNLGMNSTDPASINVTGTLTLTSDTDANNPTENPVSYPVYTGSIDAHSLDVKSSTGAWPADPPTTMNSPKAQGLSGSITIGSGGVSVGTGAMLSLNNSLTFTSASTITMEANSDIMGTGTITAGGDLKFVQKGSTIRWNNSAWADGATILQNNFNIGSHNLDIEYTQTKYGFSGAISGTGSVEVHALTSSQSIFEMKGSSTYTGGTWIHGEFGSGVATTVLRVYQSNETSEIYPHSNVEGEGQYYYTRSLGTGRITLENACISNGDQQRVTLQNEIYVPENCWGVIRPGSAISASKVKYFDIAGKITGGGAIYVSRDSGTALIRNSENDYTGGTFIGTSPSNLSTDWPATIEIGADNCLGTGAVTLNYADAGLDLNGHKLSIGGLSSEQYSSPGAHSGQYLTDVYVYDTSDDQTATLSVGGGDEYVYAGKFTDKDGNQVLTDMVKTGPGTQTFMSKLSEDLQLTVEDGTVKLSALKDATGTVISAGGLYKTPIVKGGAITTEYTLTYNTTDYLDIQGGDYTIQPGASMPGTLRVDLGNLTDFSRFDLLEKPTYTEGIGFVDPNTLDSYEPELEDAFILSYDNSAFTEYTETHSLEDWLLRDDRNRWDLTWYVNDAKFGTSLVLEYRTQIPEPASFTLLLLSGAGLFFMCRRRRVQA